jgi:hypothetical protein
MVVQKLSSPAAKIATPCAPSRLKSSSNQRAIRAKSPFSAPRCSCVRSFRSIFSALLNSALIRVCASPAVGTSEGSRFK